MFNGDIGEIVSVFYAKENVEQQDMIIVSFDGIEVTYTKPDLNQITHIVVPFINHKVVNFRLLLCQS